MPPARLFLVTLAVVMSGVSAYAGVATARLRDICRNAASLKIYKTVPGHQPSMFFQTSEATQIAGIVACIDLVDPDVSHVPEDEFLSVARPSVCAYALEIERADRSKLVIYVYNDFAVEPSESLHPKFIGVLLLTNESKRQLKACIEKRRANRVAGGN